MAVEIYASWATVAEATPEELEALDLIRAALARRGRSFDPALWWATRGRTLSCEECGTEFRAVRPSDRFCSSRCLLAFQRAAGG
jgi:hypothetical protein